MNERTTLTQLPTPDDGAFAVDTLAREDYEPMLPDDNPFAADSLFDGTDAETAFSTEEPFESTDTVGFNPFPPQVFEPEETPVLPVAQHPAAEPAVDRPTTVQVHDRSHDYPFQVHCTPESQWLHEQLRFMLEPSASQRIPKSTYRDVPAAAIFGPESTLVRPETDAPTEPPRSDNALFQGFVLLLAVTYVLLIYHNTIEIHTLFNHVFHDPSSDERRFESTGSSRYARFIRTTLLIGLLCIGILVVKYNRPIFHKLLLIKELDFAGELVVSLAISAVMLLMLGFQWIVLRLSGALTLTQPLLTQLRQLRKLYFATAVVLTAPVLLMLTLSPDYTRLLWIALAAVASAVTLFLYLRETLYLFLAKKVSILHWILYLCIVELFPVSLLWQLAVR